LGLEKNPLDPLRESPGGTHGLDATITKTETARNDKIIIGNISLE